MPSACGARSRFQFPDKPLRVERRANLGVVVEIDIDVAGFSSWRARSACMRAFRLAAFRPGPHAVRPERQGAIAVSAGIELLRPMQAAIDEIRRDVGKQRPVHGIGADERDVVRAQQFDESSRLEALVAHLERVPELAVLFRPQPGAALELVVMRPAQPRRRRYRAAGARRTRRDAPDRRRDWAAVATGSAPACAPVEVRPTRRNWQARAWRS